MTVSFVGSGAVSQISALSALGLGPRAGLDTRVEHVGLGFGVVGVSHPLRRNDCRHCRGHSLSTRLASYTTAQVIF
jgi:hypothetical protein